MKKIIKTMKAVLAAGAALSAMVFSGCAAELDAGGSGTKVTDVSSMMSRSLINNNVYMSGSVLYSEENSTANQLAPGVTVSTRIGKVNVTDTGCGNSVSVHEKKADYGYIVVKSVDMGSISFDYYQYPEDVTVQSASYSGNFTVTAGQECDLNGDGVSDVSYCSPDAGTAARKTRMWLKFLRNGEHSSMFSVIAAQYEGGNYPGGLFGINTEGRSIVTKYNYSNQNSRSAVASIANGDYVLDSVENKILVYRGSSLNSRSARALNDDELSAEEFNSTTTAEDLEFKTYEFVTDYDIYKLFAALPYSYVTEAYGEKNLTEAVEYLNRIIRQTGFVEKVLSESSLENSAEMLSELASNPVTDETGTVYIARVVLCQAYPDLCPEMTTLTNGIGEAFPELYINLGHMDDYEAADSDARAVIGNIVKHDEFKKLYPEKDADKYDPAFLSYADKYDEIYSWFGSLYYVDISSGLMNDVIGSSLLGIEDKDLKRVYKDFIKNLNLKLMVGAGGSISCANGNPKVEAKLGALAGFELKDDITFNLSKGSFFEKEPVVGKVPTNLDRYKEMYPNSSIANETDTAKAEKEAKAFFNNDQGYKSKDLGVLGTTGWVDTKDIETEDMPSLTENAKFKHVQFSPVKAFPVVVTIDLDFDLLRALKISAECDNLYIGGVVVAGLEGHAGLNWGFSRKVFGCPVPWSFYCNFDKGGNTVFEHAMYAGFPMKDIDASNVGVAVKVTVTPILKLRGGVGLGGDLWVAKTDITVGGSMTAAAPLTALAGISYSIKDGTEVKVQASGKLMFNWGLDAQFYLKAPIVSEVKKTFPIYTSDPLVTYQLFKITWKNFNTVDSEGWKVL